MFIRIVKMGFEPSKVNLFLKNFNTNKHKIRNVEGCRLLELYNDRTLGNVFFSYSYWESEAHLNAYRNSDLFKEIWKNTKILFNEKPQAWSVDKIESLP